VAVRFLFPKLGFLPLSSFLHCGFVTGTFVFTVGVKNLVQTGVVRVGTGVIGGYGRGFVICGLDMASPRALVVLPWWWQRDERGRRRDRGAMKETRWLVHGGAAVSGSSMVPP